MKDKIADITRWILYLLLALSVIPGVLFYLGVLDTDFFLNWGKILLILGVIIMLLSPVYGFITNPQNIVKLLISVGLFALIVILSYSMADVSFSDYKLEVLKTDAETSRLVGMGLYTTYIAFGLTIVAALYASVVKLFK